MKKYLIVAFVIFCLFPVCNGQSDGSFYYQALIRDAAGKLLKNQKISVRISILKNNTNGDIVYSEAHLVNTDNSGIVNLIIGKGVPESGNFQDINWGKSRYFIKLEIDDQGGSNYTTLGTTQVLAVPYASYADRAGNVNNNDTSATNELQSLSVKNDSLFISKRNGVYFKSSKWENSGQDIYYNKGKVGINIMPKADLHVNNVLRLEPGLSPSSPGEGDLFSDKPTHSLLYYNGTVWDTLGQSLWKKNGDLTYIKNGSVAIGVDTLRYDNISRHTLFEVDNIDENTLTRGELYNISTNSEVNSPQLKCKITSNVGHAATYGGIFGDAMGVFGQVQSLSIMYVGATNDNSTACGGFFSVQPRNLNFLNTSTGNYSVGGVVAELDGSLQNHPDSATVSALIAFDRIHDSTTYAGFFDGKVYISDKVGIGTKNPTRMLDVNDAMHLEPLSTPPSNPREGDIYMDANDHTLKVFDGTVWKSCW